MSSLKIAGGQGPVWVVGKGWVYPRGAITPEQRELMERTQRQCEADAAAIAARAVVQSPDQDPPTSTEGGLVVDPFGGTR